VFNSCLNVNVSYAICGIFFSKLYTKQCNMFFFSGRVLTSIILYIVFFVLALVGNVLVIATLTCNLRAQTPANIFMLSLAVSDLLVALVCMPVSITGQVLQRFVFGRAMCKIMSYIMGKFLFSRYK